MTIPWKEHRHPGIYLAAFFCGLLGVPILIGAIFAPDPPSRGGQVAIGLFGAFMTGLMLYLVFHKPKERSWKWVGPGPPDMENLPPGLDRGDIEAHRLLSKYGYDPRAPDMVPGRRSVSRTETKTAIKVPPGGGWIITPREMMEEEGEDEEKVIELVDMGTSFILQAKASGEDMSGVRIQVAEDSVSILIPSGNTWLYSIRMASDEKGNRMLRARLSDDVIPSRSWADLWDGVLRVNMPVDTLYTSDEVSAKELVPVVRNEPAPQLPEIPDHQKNKPSIYAMHVEEGETTFEVTISTEPQVRDSFRYEIEANVLKVHFEEVKRKTSKGGIVIRARSHNYIITLPSTVLRDSANHRLQGDTFHIYLHKSGR